MEDKNRWIMHIKDLRATHGLSILEAEKLALSEPRWSRWVEQQINSDATCRKTALGHMRYHGQASLIEPHDDQLRVRAP